MANNSRDCAGSTRAADWNIHVEWCEPLTTEGLLVAANFGYSPTSGPACTLRRAGCASDR